MDPKCSAGAVYRADCNNLIKGGGPRELAIVQCFCLLLTVAVVCADLVRNYPSLVPSLRMANIRAMKDLVPPQCVIWLNDDRWCYHSTGHDNCSFNAKGWQCGSDVLGGSYACVLYEGHH